MRNSTVTDQIKQSFIKMTQQESMVGDIPDQGRFNTNHELIDEGMKP